MRVNFHQIEDLARTAWSKVQAQVEQIKSSFNGAVRSIAQSFLGHSVNAGQAMQAPNLQDIALAQFKKDLQAHVGDGLLDHVGVERLAQGLIVDQDMVDSVNAHVDTQGSLALNNGLVIHSVFDDAAAPPSSPKGSARWMFVSVPSTAGGDYVSDLLVPVTVLPQDAKDVGPDELLIQHLGRTASGTFLGKARSQEWPALLGQRTQKALLGGERQPPLPRSRSFAGGASSALPEDALRPTLQGKAPVRPQGNKAYRQHQNRSFECGAVAVNGFLQANVIAAGDLVRACLDADRDLQSGKSTSFGGAFHPKLINGFKQSNNPVSISKHEFMGQGKTLKNFAGDDVSFDDQWSRLHNVILGYDAPKTEVLQVTPDAWLDARGGMEGEAIVRVLNGLLRQKPQAGHQWANYPSRAGSVILLEEMGDHHRFVDQLKHSEVDRMVCFSQQGNHWFSMVKSGNTWLRLDQLGALEQAASGIPKERCISSGELANQLQQWNVMEIICDQKLVDLYGSDAHHANAVA